MTIRHELSAMAVALGVAAMGAGCVVGDEAGSETDAVTQSHNGVPVLEAMSLEDAQSLAKAAHAVRFVAPDSTDELGVGWAWIAENCNRRADLVNFALSQGTSDSVVPAAPSSALLSQIISAPAFQSARILLTGPLNLKEQYKLPSGKKSGWTGPVSWDHHIATIVNVEGTLMVIDPSLTGEPLAIPDWIQAYVPAGTECGQLDESTWGKTDTYYLARWQFSATKPDVACGYKFEGAYGVALGKKLTKSYLKEELSGARELLAADLGALDTTVSDTFHTSLTDAELPDVSLNLKPITDAEACKLVHYGFKWCAEYKP